MAAASAKTETTEVVAKLYEEAPVSSAATAHPHHPPAPSFREKHGPQDDRRAHPRRRHQAADGWYLDCSAVTGTENISTANFSARSQKVP